MKTLYININNEQIQSNEELEVLKHDLDSDFFFYLGEKIAKGCNVENENALITDFNTPDTEEDYKQIIAQWNEIKAILFSEECKGKFEFTLPNGYIHWLEFHPRYVSVSDRNFSHGESTVITIDLEELYEDSIEILQSKILFKLQRDGLYLEIDEIIFNDDAVTRKSPIVCKIKEKYEGIGFKSYKKWLQDNKEKTRDVLDLSEKCKEEPCESESPEDFLFPIDGITLGRTLISEVNNNDIEEHQFAVSYKTDNGIVFYGYENVNNRFVYAVLESKYSMPMKWKKQIGLDFGYKYEKCIKILLNKGYKIKIKDDFGILLITPNKLYFITLEFDFRKKLDGVNVILNKCPYCNSSNFDFLDLDTAPTCKKCGKAYDEVEKNGIIDKKETNIEDPICPNCSSDDVNDDGSDYLQYTCNDCGHNWGHDNTVECPECGSDDVENDGTDNLQYECNACGFTWGGDEEYDSDCDNAGHSISDFFDSFGFPFDKTTRYDIKRANGVLESKDEHFESYKMPNGIRLFFRRHEDFIHIIHVSDNNGVPLFYKNLGIYWGINKTDFRNIFENLGFYIEEDEGLDTITAYIKCIKWHRYIELEIMYCDLKMIYLSVSIYDYKPY